MGAFTTERVYTRSGQHVKPCRLHTLQLKLEDMTTLLAAVQVYVYYELGKYYQNHKRYVRSRDDNQMAGKGSGSGKCAPEQYVGGNPNPSLPNQGAVTPCGLIAWSFFNDSFGDAASVQGPGPGAPPTSVQLDVSPSHSCRQ